MTSGEHMNPCGANLLVTAGVPGPRQIILSLTQNVPAGALVRLQASDLGALGGLRIDAVTAGERPLDIVRRFSPDQQAKDWMFFIYTRSMAVVSVDTDLHAGTELLVRFAEAPACNVAELIWTVTAGIVDDVAGTDFRPVSNEVGFRFVAAGAEHLRAYRRPNGSVAARHFDRYGNPTEVDAPATQAPVGSAPRVTVTDSAGRTAVSNPTPVAAGGMNIYFGDIHWHSRVSCDGQRLLPDALISARDDLCLDFAAAADHLMPDGRYIGDFDPRYQTDVCTQLNEPGTFCTLPTAEFGSRRGHANLICDSFETFLDIVARLPAALGQYDLFLPDSRALIPICPPGKSIIVPHHTGKGADPADVESGQALWGTTQFEDPPENVIMRLIEIVQTSGSYAVEAVDELWLAKCPGRRASAATAFAGGYRLGFTGGTDNHQGWPSRGKSMPGTGGLTAVLAESLDTASLFAALHARRCYATSGARIAAEATMNGQPIGSELTLSPADVREFDIRIHATAPLTHVQIVCIDRVIAELPADGSMDFHGTWIDTDFAHACYYVRARQQDGHCLWLSPWWVDVC